MRTKNTFEISFIARTEREKDGMSRLSVILVISSINDGLFIRIHS
jgi:hypothetical protein